MITILQGDCIEQMKTMPEKSVQCCVTSPPYWGLRDYGVHGQIGLEPTPREFVAKMVAVFAEVWRVLKDDGTLWMNMGDSFNAGTSSKRKAPKTSIDVGGWGDAEIDGGARINFPGLKTKDLCGMPWRVAFALQEYGWYLRSDIIWHKPNPMPESVTDRPTKAHEYIFLLSKNERYFYNADAIKEQVNGGAHARTPGNKGHKHTAEYEKTGDQRHRTKAGLVDYAAKVRAKNNTSFNDAMAVMPDVRNKRSVWTVPSAPYKEAHFATYPPDLIKPCILAGSRPGDMILDPFFGSGCTGMVALELGRLCTGIELNPEYVELAKRRCDVTPGLQLH